MDRRDFIFTGTLLTAATLLTNSLSGALKRARPARGIQLYMVRDEMISNTPGTLSKLGKMGYQQLESYGGDKGTFWGLHPKEFQKIAADNGLKLVSTHHNPMSLTEFERLAEQAGNIDMKYLVCPWLGPQKHMEFFKRAANDFNTRGAICKNYGLRYAYHPHDYPYQQVDGQLPIDILLAYTDKALVDFEMDVYYTVTEGYSPYDYLHKYKGRFKLMHLRDVSKKRFPKGSTEESACDLGEGIINFPELIAAAQDNGATYFFIEQSHYENESPLQSAQKNAAYLRTFPLIR